MYLTSLKGDTITTVDYIGHTVYCSSYLGRHIYPPTTSILLMTVDTALVGWYTLQYVPSAQTFNWVPVYVN